ncbi:MAG: SDR family NAD(P)-dependent oxidoreductase [Pseudooceanicola sp.]
MSRALIIGASGGIGQALTAQLRAQGHSVAGLSRSADGLDITSEQSVIDCLARVDGPFDKIIVATGGLEIGPHAPEKTLKALDPDAFAAQFALNATGPALILKHAMQFLPRDRQSVFAVLSARVGSIEDNRLGGWYSYRASKAALNQIVRTAAIEVARSHPLAICVALHPGTVATAFTRNYQNHPAVSPGDAALNLVSVIGALSPADTGRFFDWSGAPVAW